MNRLYTLASAISPVLCLAFVALWVRSSKLFGPGDQVIFAAADGRVWQVSTLRGAVWILTVPGFSHPRIASGAVLPRRAGGKPREMTEIVLNNDNRSRTWKQGRFLGVFYRSDVARPGLIQSKSNRNARVKAWDHDYLNVKSYEAMEPMAFHEIVIPTWLLTLVSGTGVLYLLVPLARLLRRRKRLRSGRCMQCGYDLRASIEKCPECGAGILLGWVGGISEA
jgi:hypothetical protein